MKKSLIFAGIFVTAVLFNGAIFAQTSSVSKLIDAFAKTVKDNPNDTSSADLTMKALGNFAGGGGVSAADSVKATKSFMTAKGGSGFSYQYITTMTSKQRGTNNDTSILNFTSGGEGRSEMNLPGMMGIKGGNALVVLAHADQRKFSLTLDAGEKTYSLNVIDTALINNNGSDYRATKIGNESVQGYNCIHAKVVSTIGSGMFKSTSSTDIWTSTEVPGYATFKSMSVQNVTPSMMRALEQAGCGGFFVKMTSQSKDYSMTMALAKAQAKTFPATMFEIPAGYKESKQNIFSHMTGARN